MVCNFHYNRQATNVEEENMLNEEGGDKIPWSSAKYEYLGWVRQHANPRAKRSLCRYQQLQKSVRTILFAIEETDISTVTPHLVTIYLKHNNCLNIVATNIFSLTRLVKHIYTIITGIFDWAQLIYNEIWCLIHDWAQLQTFSTRGLIFFSS